MSTFTTSQIVKHAGIFLSKQGLKGIEGYCKYMPENKKFDFLLCDGANFRFSVEESLLAKARTIKEINAIISGAMYVSLCEVGADRLLEDVLLSNASNGLTTKEAKDEVNHLVNSVLVLKMSHIEGALTSNRIKKLFYATAKKVPPALSIVN